MKAIIGKLPTNALDFNGSIRWYGVSFYDGAGHSLPTSPHNYRNDSFTANKEDYGSEEDMTYWRLEKLKAFQ